MRKKIILAIFVFLSLSAIGQQDFLKFVDDYYRVNPFEGKFSSFIKALTTDRQLLKKQYSDASENGHNFSGTYKVFNPFSINANDIKMQFESKGEVTYFGVPTPMYDYILTARFDDNLATRKKIKKDYWLMANRFRWLYTIYRFGDVYDRPLRRKDLGENGEYLNFYFKGYRDQVSSCLHWTTLPSSNEIELKVTVSFAVISNRAYPLGHYPGRTVDENYDLVAWKK